MRNEIASIRLSVLQMGNLEIAPADPVGGVSFSLLGEREGFKPE